MLVIATNGTNLSGTAELITLVDTNIPTSYNLHISTCYHKHRCYGQVDFLVSKYQHGKNKHFGNCYQWYKLSLLCTFAGYRSDKDPAPVDRCQRWNDSLLSIICLHSFWHTAKRPLQTWVRVKWHFMMRLKVVTQRGRQPFFSDVLLSFNVSRIPPAYPYICTITGDH